MKQYVTNINKMIRGKIIAFTNRSVTIIPDDSKLDSKKLKTNNAMIYLQIGDYVEFYNNAKGIITYGRLISR